MYSSTVADMESLNKSSSYTTSKAYSVKSSPKKRSKSGGKGTKIGKDKTKRSFKTVEPWWINNDYEYFLIYKRQIAM